MGEVIVILELYICWLGNLDLISFFVVWGIFIFKSFIDKFFDVYINLWIIVLELCEFYELVIIKVNVI